MDIKYFLILLLIPSICFGATDPFGGNDQIHCSNPVYQTGTATSVGEYTLTDTSKNWVEDSLAGQIIQADSSVNFFMSIIHNTSDTITVEGSNTSGVWNRANRQINDENNGTESYTIYRRVDVEKIGDRWWSCDPMDHAFWIVGINNWTPTDTRRGYDKDGTFWTTNLNANTTYGGYGTDTAGMASSMWKILGLLKTEGFNWTGEAIDMNKMVPGGIVDPATLNGQMTSDRFTMFPIMLRISKLTLGNTADWSVGGSNYHDALDADFQQDIIDAVNTCSGTEDTAFSGITLMGDYNTVTPGCPFDRANEIWHDYYLSPFEDGGLNLCSIPFFGWVKTDEEPVFGQQEVSNYHLGYAAMIANNESKKYAVEYLLADDNGATEHLAGKYANIAALNAAWEGACDYADNAALLAEDGTTCLNTLLTYEPGGETNIAGCRPSYNDSSGNKAALWDWEPCDQVALTPNIMEDLNAIAEIIHRVHERKVHDAVSTLIPCDPVIIGLGLHGSKEYRSDGRGSHSPAYMFEGSVDGATKYVDMIAIGNIPGAFISSSTESYYAAQRDFLKSMYAATGVPMMHVSTWVNAEADSGVTWTGVVDADPAPTSTVFYDAEADFNTASDWTGALYATPRLYVSCNLDQDPTLWKWHLIATTGAGDDTLTVAATSARFGPGLDSWIPGNAALSTDCPAGSTYWIFRQDNLANFDGYKNEAPTPHIWFPKTQEERATKYVAYIKDMQELEADNGDKFIAGFSHWGPFDFGFSSAQKEKANFGLFSPEMNLYDGSATIANGEPQDTGDFLTGFLGKTSSVYQDISLIDGKKYFLMKR